MMFFAVILFGAVSGQTVQLNETANMTPSCLAAQTQIQENIETLSDRMGNLENSLEKLRKDLNQEAVKFIVEKYMNDVSKTNPELPCNQTVCTPPCENGGQCMTNNVCSCAASFFGDRCQDAVCTPPCENGGQCMTNNVCSCATSFFGDRCQDDGAKCGVGNHVEGNTKRRLLWPWMAAVIRYDPESSHYICDGSIIHRHFVLTSAECMTSYSSPGWSVELGLSDLKTQKYKIWAVHFHPQLDRKNRDYDFALLETEEPISFNRFVRPVCLPPREVPEDSPFYKPESTVAAVDLNKYMQSRSFSLNPLPHISNLTIRHHDECRSILKEYKREEYHRSPGLWLCAEPSFHKCLRGGTPLMQSRLANGTQTWTQVGIRSWAGYCNTGVGGPRLDRQMAWVEATIASASKR